MIREETDIASYIMGENRESRVAVLRGGGRRTRLKDRDYRRDELPYGVWTLTDGELVLFNRKYQPIYRNGSGSWQPAIRFSLVKKSNDDNACKVWKNWISGIEKQDYFYNDGDLRYEYALIVHLKGLMRDVVGYVPEQPSYIDR